MDYEDGDTSKKSALVAMLLAWASAVMIMTIVALAGCDAVRIGDFNSAPATSIPPPCDRDTNTGVDCK